MAKHKSLLEIDDPAAIDSPESETKAGAGQRPTLIPDFDPQALAEASEVRERAQTITNELELERARLASLQSRPTPRPQVYSLVEIEAAEADLDVLDEEEQVALLTARLMPLSRVPQLTKPAPELGELLEDPKTAYVAGFIDGVLPLETILEVTGLPLLDTLRVLDRMLAQSVIVIRGD